MNHAKFHQYFRYFLILITAILAEHIYAAELCNNYFFSALKGIPFISCSTAFIILMMCIMPSPKLISFLCSCFFFSISSLCILPLSHQPIHVYEVYIYIGFFAGIAGLLLVSISMVKPLILRFLLNSAGVLCLIGPALCLWIYYFITGSWIKTSTVLAISQTNFYEAINYLKMYNLLPVLMFGIVLAFFSIHSIKARANMKFHLFTSVYAKWITIVLLLTSSIFLLYTCRENLFTDIYIDSKNYLESYQQYNLQRTMRQSKMNSLLSALKEQSGPGVYVLVIGESESRLHMGAYGYPRGTTPWLSSIKDKSHVILFDHAYSCYTQTVPVLTYALTAKNQYNTIPLEKAPSLLEAAHAAGFDTVWISNQMQFGIYDTPISYIASTADKALWMNSYIGNESGTRIKTSDYDEIVLKGLKQIQPSSHMLIVIHLMGNHFIYKERYPSSYNVYQGGNSFIDTYDNSILYNDHVVSEIYNTVSHIPHFQAFIYFSDHGEGIDYGLTHDAVNFKYPITYIPMYMIFSQEYINNRPDAFDTLKAHKNDDFTNDLMFNALMGIMGIQIPELSQPENDLTSSKYDSRPERFLTMYGTKRIIDDPNSQYESKV